MLTTDQALVVAGRRQRSALADAAHFGAALGSPVRFICRHTPEGAEFEAVLMDEARSCAIVSPAGALTWLNDGRRRDPVADLVTRSARRFVRRPASAPALGEAKPVALAETVTVPAITLPDPEPVTVVAPTAPARAEPQAPPVATRPCAKRDARLRLPFGARREAVVRLEWGACDRECCRDRARPLFSMAVTRR